jgi:hypothetical protein
MTGIRFLEGELFLFANLGSSPAAGCRGDIFPGVAKRPERETDQSNPSFVDIENAWSFNSTLPARLHNLVLRENSTFNGFHLISEPYRKQYFISLFSWFDVSVDGVV